MRYLLGAMLVFNFFVLLVTGIYLSTTFSPSSQTAWESVFYIQNVMTMGWFVRGFHHFASQTMVVLIAVFFFQLVLDKAYAAPREMSFWSTILLILMVMGLAHTGYLLPWDQRGYAAAEVFTNIAGSTPVVGAQVKEVIQGGPVKGHQTITRLYAIHAVILPLKILGLFALHLFLFHRSSKLASGEAKDEKRIPIWPGQAMLTMQACFGLTLILTILTLRHHGAELTAPADPAEPFSAARPEWYFLFLFRLLKLEFVEHFGLAFGAIFLPGMIATVFILFPFIAKVKIGHVFNVLFTTFVLVSIVGLTALAMSEDSQDQSYLKALAKAKKDASRARTLAMVNGIPVEGGVSLLRNDPLTQGPHLFAMRCASCHHFNGHDGTGKKSEGKATAADLGNFGSREWNAKVLTDYHKVFAPLKNAKWDGEDIGDGFLDGEMATWSSDHRERLLDPKNKDDFDALVEFLYAQSDRPDALKLDDPKVKRGRDIYENGSLTNGEFDSVCSDCHAMKPRGESELLGDFGIAPTLTGYGSQQAMREFIKNPGLEKHYGYDDKNAMPAFESQLTEDELDLLVRWMVGDYLQPPGKKK